MKKARYILAILLIALLAMSTVSGSAQVNMTLTLEAEIRLTGSTPLKADSYTVRMKGLDGAPMPEEAEDGAVTVSREGIGTVVLPALSFTSMGLYKYEVRQIPGSHPSAVAYDGEVYRVEVYILRDAEYPAVNIYREDGTKEDELVFTNEYAEVNLTVKKSWDDNFNEAKKRAESVKVTLKADGKELKTLTLSEKNRWAATVKGLPVYEDGRKINYTWTEEEVKNYTLSNTKTSEDGTVTTLTNKVKTGGGGGTPFIPDDDLGMGMIINVGDCLE